MEVKNAVDGISSFPVSAERPIVFKQRARSMAMFLGLSGDVSLLELKKYADEIIGMMLIPPQTKKEGNDVVVVVSAMSGETNRLINLATQLDNRPSSRELDVLMTTGEQVTASLLSMALVSRGYSAISLIADQVGIKTSSHFGKARIQSVNSDILKEHIEHGRIVIAAGFQGRDEENNITTLGRGGTDTSAVAIAAAIGAEECLIFTDVEGVYTTDPRIVSDARKLNKVTFEEMLEMAYSGSKVLQTRSVAMAMTNNVRLRVLSTFKEVGEPNGTILVNNNEEIMERRVITGISYSKNEAQITLSKMPDHPGLSSNIFGALAEQEVNVDMIIQNVSGDGKSVDITFTINKEELSRARIAIDAIKDVVKFDNLKINEDIAKISVIGVGMISHSGVAHTMFKTLADKGVNLLLISTSEIKISVLINKEYGELAVRVLHDAYGLKDR